MQRKPASRKKASPKGKAKTKTFKIEGQGTTYAVKVYWVDAAEDCSGEWKDFTDSDVAPVVTCSLGWVTSRDKKHIVVAHTINQYGHTSGRITIPTQFIQKIERI